MLNSSKRKCHKQWDCVAMNSCHFFVHEQAATTHKQTEWRQTSNRKIQASKATNFFQPHPYRISTITNSVNVLHLIEAA